MVKATVLGEKVMKGVRGGASTSCFCGPINFCFCLPPFYSDYQGKYEGWKWDQEANDDADNPNP